MAPSAPEDLEVQFSKGQPMARASVPIAQLGIHMHSMREYNVRELGPWDRESDDIWCSPDPFDRAQGQRGFVWWSRHSNQYFGLGGTPIYFAGRDFRASLGYAPIYDELDVGKPSEQWEADLRRDSPEEYLEFRRSLSAHLWW